MVGLGEAGGEVAARQVAGVAEIGVGGDGLVDREDGRELVHLNDDRAACGFERGEIVGGDDGERLAEEDGGVFDEQQLVLYGGAEAIVAGDVGGGEDRGD